MVTICFDEQNYPCKPGQTVLDALLEAGLKVSYGCKAGLCQSCLMQVCVGKVCQSAQLGLSPSDCEKGYFLPCQCQPKTSISVQLPKCEQQSSAIICGLTLCTPTLLRVALQPKRQFDYFPGQYLSVTLAKQSQRNYYIASAPGEFPLVFYVERKTGGQMSAWLFDQAHLGDELGLTLKGQCYYQKHYQGLQLFVTDEIALGATLAMACQVQNSVSQPDFKIFLINNHYSPTTLSELIPSKIAAQVDRFQGSSHTITEKLRPYLKALDKQSLHLYLLGSRALFADFLAHCQQQKVTTTTVHQELFTQPESDWLGDNWQDGL